jgi:MFS family permease
LILVKLKETLEEKEPLTLKLFRLKKDEIIEKRVLVPSIILFLSVFSFGVVLTIVPDFSEFLGIKNKGLFFAVFTLSSLGIRLIAGKTSDRYGRVPVMRMASVTMVVAMVTIAFAESKLALMGAGVLFGSAVGMYSPTTAAWVIDLSLDKFRGRALATMYIFLEAGIGVGAITSGFLYNNQSENFKLVFLFSAGMAFLAFLSLIFVKRDRKPEMPFA